MSASLHQRIERRIGWLFGTYRVHRREMTDPWLAVGPATCGTGGVEYRSGMYVTLGRLGLYMSRADGLERGQDRALSKIEHYANGGTR